MQPTDTLSLQQQPRPIATGMAGAVVGIKTDDGVTGSLQGWAQTDGKTSLLLGPGAAPPGGTESGQRRAGPRPLSQRPPLPGFFSPFLPWRPRSGKGTQEAVFLPVGVPPILLRASGSEAL